MSNERMRIDKWLWVARFFKTRSLASVAIASHKIRIAPGLVDAPKP